MEPGRLSPYRNVECHPSPLFGCQIDTVELELGRGAPYCQFAGTGEDFADGPSLVVEPAVVRETRLKPVAAPTPAAIPTSTRASLLISRKEYGHVVTVFRFDAAWRALVALDDGSDRSQLPLLGRIASFSRD
jgi:hypothetical protein